MRLVSRVFPAPLSVPLEAAPDRQNPAVTRLSNLLLHDFPARKAETGHPTCIR
jgi:hypothetical protein